MLKILTVFGTRPEAIKMAPLVLQLKKTAGLQCRVAVTAQHREMLDQVLQIFDIKPDYDLNIMQAGQTLFDITARALLGLKEVLDQFCPDLVLVHGDTTTTFTAALAAYYNQIPVGHVEAGLRTNNKYSPFPEEINRRLTGVLTDLHFAPTPTAKENLLIEGIDPQSVYVTGNTVIDALQNTIRRDYKFDIPALDGINYHKQRILLVTVHRRENLGQPVRDICQALQTIKTDYPDVKIIFPVHKNPVVRETVQQILGTTAGIHLIEPLDYQPFINLMQCSYLVLTDSGGLQEEAPALGKPVLVLRNTTERPEAVQAGTVRLIDTKQQYIERHTRELLDNSAIYKRMAEAVNPYGDGQAASRITKAICYQFKLAEKRPEDWRNYL